MVLTSSGEVLTNNHVIDGATSISATDVGNGRTYKAKVVGYDRTGDVAVIQLDRGQRPPDGHHRHRPGLGGSSPSSAWATRAGPAARPARPAAR